MTKLYVKIIGVEPSILVRFASENSKKPIDEYPPMLFGIPDASITTPEDFVESIRPQLEQYCWSRDITESQQPVDVASWVGFATSFDAEPLAADYGDTQLIPSLKAPEVFV